MGPADATAYAVAHDVVIALDDDAASDAIALPRVSAANANAALDASSTHDAAVAAYGHDAASDVVTLPRPSPPTAADAATRPASNDDATWPATANAASAADDVLVTWSTPAATTVQMI